MDSAKVSKFQRTVLAYYRVRGRHELPWRLPAQDGSFDPYKILVSELMLQQTQVPRVLPKFREFIARFPDFNALAGVELGEVLQVWSGLGYNRRAKFLWQAARAVVDQYQGRLPDNSAELITLPGIGPNTAGAVLAYAFNKPAVFIETNIRTVFIHHFLGDQTAIDDKVILDLVARTLPDNVREWYWALMDYGTYLKQTVGNLNMLSKHYVKQSAFHGSKRQLRGWILRLLGTAPATFVQLEAAVNDERLRSVLDDLIREGLIRNRGKLFLLG